eukprot:1082489-Rhodomonas_salina.3
MRMSYGTFIQLCNLNPLRGKIEDSTCGLTWRVLKTRQFKVATMANGHWIGISTAKAYTEAFCNAIISKMKLKYMQCMPDRDRLACNQAKFAELRGIHCIAITVDSDGTHVPWIPDNVSCSEDYHNYEGWYSISFWMFVDAFCLFVDGDIGHPGRAGNSSIAEYSWLIDEIHRDPEAWLGEGGCVIGDGGFGNHYFLMAPFANASTNSEIYFNYCFSSSRFYVEQCFGWWKNGF